MSILVIMTSAEENKTVRLSKSTYLRIANLGTLGRNCTFEDIIKNCVDIAEPYLAKNHNHSIKLMEAL
jgi:hypothetical protein